MNVVIFVEDDRREQFRTLRRLLPWIQVSAMRVLVGRVVIGIEKSTQTDMCRPVPSRLGT